MEDINNEINKFFSCVDERIKPNWDNFFMPFSDGAEECNMIFRKVMYFHNYREDEKKDGKKPISWQTLNEKWKKNIDTKKNNYKGDPFYFLGDLKAPDNKIGYYDDHMALHYLKEILDPRIQVPTDWQDPNSMDLNFSKFYYHSLALKKAFHFLAKKENPQLKIVFRLWEIQQSLYQIALWWQKITEQNEIQSERNRKNISSITPQRLERIKKHKLYDEIKKILEAHTKKDEVTMEEERNINQILVKMGKKNRTTRQRYRELIINDFYLKNQKIK